MSMTSDEDQAKLSEAMNQIADVLSQTTSNGGMEETRARLIAVGLKPDALTSGELALVGQLTGSVAGALIEHGGTPGTVKAMMINGVLNGAAVDSMPRRKQRVVRAFHHAVLAAFTEMCRPGTAELVMVFFLDVCLAAFDQYRAGLPPTPS